MKLLALEYTGDMQTYLAPFNELNSCVQLPGQLLKRVRTAAVTLDMYRNIWRKHGKIPDTDGDQLYGVQEAEIEEEEMVRSLAAKKQIARPHQEKEKEAAPKAKQERKAIQAKEMEMAPAVTTGELGPNKYNKFLEQEILRESFKAAIKDTPEEECQEHRTKEADCQRCGRDGHKTRACFAQTTTKGTKLPPPPEIPTRQASAAGTKRTQDDKLGKSADNSAAIGARPKKAIRTVAI